jgi:hypothetical protein
MAESGLAARSPVWCGTRGEVDSGTSGGVRPVERHGLGRDLSERRERRGRLREEKRDRGKDEQARSKGHASPSATRGGCHHELPDGAIHQLGQEAGAAVSACSMGIGRGEL